jgi:secretion/DNA translocation related CpaE-like protein
MDRQEDGRGTGGGWLPETETIVCCISSDAALTQECARVAAVAGVGFEAAESADAAASLWSRADLVLLGADVSDVPPRRHDATVLVGRAADRHILWQRAADLGIDHVAELPDAAGWLVEFLGRGRSEAASGTIVGIVGGCGGAGASTAASLIAGAVALEGSSVVLVDGDRLAGGLEACLSERGVEGLHWPDLVSASGAINPDQLRAALPRVRGVAVLSWPARPQRAVRIAASAVSGALEAARAAFDLVVVDIGRGREGLEDFAWACDRLLVVVPGRLAGALSATQLLHELPPVPTGVIVRGRPAEGMDAEQLAEVLDCPLAGTIPQVRGVPQAAEAGRLLDVAPARPVRRLARTLLDGLSAEADEGEALAVGRRLASRTRGTAR